MRSLQPRIHGLAFKGEDPEDALVNAIERLAPRESLERFDAQGELAERQRALGRETAGAPASTGNEVVGLDDDALPATLGHLPPPGRPPLLLIRVAEID